LQLAYDIIHDAATKSGIEPIPAISKITAPFLPPDGSHTKHNNPFYLPHKLRFYFHTDLDKQAVWKVYRDQLQLCSDFTVNIIQDGPARQYLLVNGEFVTTTLSDEAFVFVCPLDEMNKFNYREGNRARRDTMNLPLPPHLDDNPRAAGSRTYDYPPGSGDPRKYARHDDYRSNR